MTICIAAIEEGRVLLGSDGISLMGDEVVRRSDFKWLTSPCGRWAISDNGFTTGNEILALKQANLWPDNPDPKALARKMKEIFEAEGGQANRKDPGMTFGCWETSWIVAYDDGKAAHLWVLCADLLSSVDAMDAWLCAGSGEEYAAGAMHASAQESAEVAMNKALEAATHYSVSCGGSITTRWLADCAHQSENL